MNEMSWLIYLSNISPNIGGLLIFTGSLVLGIAIGHFIWSVVVTVLAIAASEFGDQILHTKTANLAEQALDA